MHTRTIAPVRRHVALSMLALAGLLALATFTLVTHDAGAQTPTPTATATLPSDRRLELAPIEKIEVQVLQTSPVQYTAVVTSGLPGGCAQFYSIVAARDGARIDITVQNSMPVATVPCTAIYGTTTNTVNLGSEFQAGTNYTVIVNSAVASTKSTTFVAQGATPTPTATATATAAPTGTATATPTAPLPANTGSAGLHVDMMDAVTGGAALIAALVVVALLAVRVPRRR